MRPYYQAIYQDEYSHAIQVAYLFREDGAEELEDVYHYLFSKCDVLGVHVVVNLVSPDHIHDVSDYDLACRVYQNVRG